MSLAPARRTRQKRWWWPTVLSMALIWTLSGQSQPLGVALAHPLDWAAHAAVYAALGFFAARASGSFAAGLLLSAWFGAFDEVHQAFVPGREAGIGDWWFDALGAALGAWLALRVMKLRALRLTAPEESASSRRGDH